jgi:biofilm PGA synthesis N-glycosyltransferase PgaC
MTPRELTYALVTPVRDEAQALPRLANSVFEQSVLPEKWIIVDTGSTDETPRLVRRLAEKAAWILPTSIDKLPLARGGPIVRAFSRGLELVVPATDIIVKLDADITVPPTFFESIRNRFAFIEDLGIASGSLYEWDHGAWRRQKGGTDNFLRGACRAYRWQCLSEILPLEERIGWDGLDLVKARIRGWKIEQFEDLPFRHHRRLGQRDRSRLESWYAVGEAAHYMGYRPYYAVLRSLFQARRDVRATALIAGFVIASLCRRQRHADPRVLSYVRSKQRLGSLPRRGAEALGRADGARDS